MNKMKLIVTLIVIVMSIAVTGWCNEGVVAVINMKELIKDHPQAISDREVLKGMMKEYEQERAQMEEVRDKLKSEIQTLGKTMDNKAFSEAAREKKRDELRVLIGDLERSNRAIKENSIKRQKELTGTGMKMQDVILEGVRDVVENYANENGIDIVVDSSVVLYSKDKMEITKDILKIIKKKEK